MAKEKKLSEIVQKETIATTFKETYPTIDGQKEMFIISLRTKMYFPNRIKFSSNVCYKNIEVVTTLDKGCCTKIEGYKGKIPVEYVNYLWVHGVGYPHSTQWINSHLKTIKSLKKLYTQN